MELRIKSIREEMEELNSTERIINTFVGKEVEA